MALGLLTPTILIFLLNPKFDPYFKEYLSWMNVAPNFSTRYLRASLYGNWVVAKKHVAKGQPKVQAFDFRSRVGWKTYLLCYLHTLNHAFFLLFGVLALLTRAWWGLG